METLLLSAVLVTAILPTWLQHRGMPHTRTFPTTTFLLAAVTFVVSAVGNLNPDVLHLFQRDRSRLLEGDWWRLITPLFVQDGGWPGTWFNLLALVALGIAVEVRYRGRTLLVVYFLAGIISEMFAYTLLQHQGFAGNSVANMGTAGTALVMLCTRKTPPSTAFGVIGLLSGTLLMLTLNLHGVGFGVGGLAGAVMVLRSRRAGGYPHLGETGRPDGVGPLEQRRLNP